MSEKSKGDTSRIVNNPLLSASVTGLTFDDFPSAPLLLPAAPPIERSPPPVLDLNSDTKEPAPGQSLDSDSDVFSEINLNATTDEDYSSQPGTTSFVSPLEENPAVSDSSLLSQAASSFSQLPSVASTVFSTFSKVIKDYSPTNQDHDDFGDIKTEQPTLATFDNIYAPEPYDTNSNLTSTLPDQPPPEPPKFYSPTEFSPQQPAANTQSTGQNTYRLSAKKKTYAPIPGLSANIHQPAATSLAASGPSIPPLPPAPQSNITFPPQPQTSEVDYSSIPEQSNFTQSGPVFNLQASSSNLQQQFSQPAPIENKKEERRGLFSLTNVVAPVWQNLSGLVGRSNNQENQTASNSSFHTTYGSSSHSEQISTAQYFSPEGSFVGVVQTPPIVPQPANNQPSSTSQYFGGIQSAPLQPPSSIPAPGIPLVSPFLNPSQTPPIASQPVTSNPPNPTPTPPTFLNPSQTPPIAPQPITSNPPNPTPTPPTNFVPGAQVLSASPQGTPPLSKSATPPVIPLANLSLSSQPTVPSQANPPLPQAPPAGSGNTFRLQKGTRHYRTPLGIPTNPAAPSNFLQPNVTNYTQPIVNQPSVPFSTTLPGVTTHQQGPPTSASFFNPIASASTVEQISFAAVAPPPSIINQSGFTQQPIVKEQLPSIPFIPTPGNFTQTEGPKAQSIPLSNNQPIDNSHQAAPLQSFFPPQPNPPLNITSSFNQFAPPTASPAVEKSVLNPIQKEIEESKPESDLKTVENTNFGHQLNTNTDKADIPKSAEKHLEESVLTPCQPHDEAGKSSDYTIQQQKVEEKDFGSLPAPSVPPFTSKEESVQEPIESGETSNFGHQINSSHFVSNVFESTLPAKTQNLDFGQVSESSLPPKVDVKPIPDKPQFAETVNPTPQPFTLTNYFAAQPDSNLAPFSEHAIDANANKSINQLTSAPKTESSLQGGYQPAAVNFFSQTFQVGDSQNNNASQFASNLPDPLSFFDSFQQSAPSSTPVPQSNQVDDELNSNLTVDAKTEIDTSFQIQNFFNNPPQNLNQSASDLNYKLVGSNLIKNKYVDNLSSTSRPISPQSNVVEPPSSACSEFSADTTSNQNTLNLSKLTNVDFADGFKLEYTDDLDPEIMALMANNKANSTANAVYQPAVKHWFYKKKVDDKFIWTPFTHHDSALIEAHFSDPNVPKIVAVEGGRYDVNIDERLRVPIFWSGEATEVRRCSWFYKAVDSRYVPYEEPIADQLETEYEEACSTGEWHRKIPLPTGETVVFHGATVLVQFLQTQSTDSWGATTQTTSRPRIVKRDLEDFNIETGESNKVDHLLFMVHGIGSVCDLKFRTVEEVVDEFRNIATQLIQSHYKNSCESGRVGRVEVLPVSWHSELHSEESGIDEKLKAITLESIPKLRNFANDTLLDILFYTSPIFCQSIMDTVAGTMNKVYLKYCQRNPTFNGGVSLAGHSLGSLILFDLLCHQKPLENSFIQNSENPDQPIEPLQIRAPADETDMTSKQISYTIGPAGTGQAYISYPQLVFQPKKFFALGSPIGMFVTIRGIDRLGLEFKLPTCPGFYNIFHPYDPVAYRIEALVNTDLSTVRPVLVPHHKGRKRMHLELRETMTRVGADIKQKIVDTFKNTMDTVYQLTAKQKTSPDPEEIEKEVDKVLEMQLKIDKEPRSRTNSSQSDVDTGEVDLPLGKLNEGKRIDHVLQEAPLEFFNEYLFALTSHVCYWESADTILFIMKEIYSSLDVKTDSQVPQQSMTIERPQSSERGT